MTAAQYKVLLPLARSAAPGFRVGAEPGWDGPLPLVVFFVGDAPGAQAAADRVSRALVLKCYDEDWPVDFAVETRETVPPDRKAVAKTQRRSRARR